MANIASISYTAHGPQNSISNYFGPSPRGSSQGASMELGLKHHLYMVWLLGLALLLDPARSNSTWDLLTNQFACLCSGDLQQETWHRDLFEGVMGGLFEFHSKIPRVQSRSVLWKSKQLGNLKLLGM